MADIIDIANDLAEAQTQAALAAVPKPEAIVGSPVCLNCGEALYGLHHRWCDSDCRDDWAARQPAGQQPVFASRGTGSYNHALGKNGLDIGHSNHKFVSVLGRP